MSAAGMLLGTLRARYPSWSLIGTFTMKVLEARNLGPIR
jgi:hypothetical protein